MVSVKLNREELFSFCIISIDAIFLKLVQILDVPDFKSFIGLQTTWWFV